MKEDTKEIKNLEELESKEPEIEEVIEEIQLEKKEEKKKKSKKTLWIIVSIVAGIILLVILLLSLLPKKEKNSTSEEKLNDSKFVTKIKKSIQSGDFDKEIKKGLKENNINTNAVCLLRLDVDSDGEQEIVVYAEKGTNKAILQLEVDEEIVLDDSFLVDSKDSLGYAYSSEKRENYWYTEYTKNYTIISSAKKIIKEEDFLQNYFSLTKTYHEKPILNQCIEYKLNGELNAKKLEKTIIKNKQLLEDNKIKEDEIKDAYDKYIKEKEEKEKKEKEEAEQKAREEEERKKLAGTLVIGTKNFKYGKYIILTSEGEPDGELYLYATEECVYKSITCDYSIGDIKGSNGELVPGIALSTGQTFTPTVDDGVLLEPTELFLIKYAGE